MKRRIGYAKLGRSMPLSLADCGSLGGDIEMVPTLKLLAERHPDVEFVLIGRNSGEDPAKVGLPPNVSNPWRIWQPHIRGLLNTYQLSYPNLTIADHQRVADILHDVTRHDFTELDGVIMWLGQHGTSNQPLPKIDDRTHLTKPYDWATLYASYLLRGINAWRDVDPWTREEVLLNSDVRNYPKYRDGKWPWQHPILSQYNDTYNVKHERAGDGRDFEEWSGYGRVSYTQPEDRDQLWLSRAKAVYSRLEVSALLPRTPFGDTVRFDDDWNRPHNFGIIVNETRREVNVAKARRTVLREWVLPLYAIDRVGFMHGKWTQRTLNELNIFAHTHLGLSITIDIRPISQLEYIPKLQTARCTLTTPASGSGWATAKPWESFAAGVVCFFHPDYDDQDNILEDADPELRSFLRVHTPGELRERLTKLEVNEAMWRHYVHLQRDHFMRAVREERHLTMIEERLDLP